MEDIRLQLACWERDRLHIEAIRFAVYMAEKGDPASLAADYEDTHCRHALASDPEGRHVATGRLERNGKLSRVVVLPEYRQQRLGDAVIQFLIAQAREIGLGSVYLHSEERHVPFLHRLGFMKTGSLTPTGDKRWHKLQLDLAPQPPKS